MLLAGARAGWCCWLVLLAGRAAAGCGWCCWLLPVLLVLPLVLLALVGGPLSSGGPEGDGEGLSLVTYGAGGAGPRKRIFRAT